MQFDERISWFYEAIAMSVGMQGRVVGFGQVYLEASKDAKGQWLDGGRSYRMRVPANAPVKQFWSITLYDNLSRSLLITPQGADGSVDVDFGPIRPAGAKNWIQTTPGKGWFAYFRFYAPTEPYFAKTWQLNDITPIQP